MHLHAIYLEQKRPSLWWKWIGLALAATVIKEILLVQFPQPDPHYLWGHAALTLLLLTFSRFALRLARIEMSLGARGMAFAYLFCGLTYATRFVTGILGLSDPDGLTSHGLGILNILSIVFVAIMSNVGVIGLYLERIQSKNIQLTLDEERSRINAELTIEMASIDRQRGLGELSAALAHELGQPITGILMDSSFLSQELEQVKPRNPEHLATVQNITDQASRASQILQGIRNFIKPGKTHMTTVALPEVIQSVQAMLKPLLRSHDVKIQVSCHSEHPTIRGDVAQLSQVFLNLLKNSFEARNPSKPLTVSITIEQKEESQEVVIEDDGIGMSDEQLAMCGMPFFTTKSGGMGIGLAISRRIVEHHGGTFAVSRPASGHGLRTTLSFPNSEGQWVAKR